MDKSLYSERNERLCKLLIEARKRCKLTQSDVAAKLARPQSFVSKYESGERRLDVVEFLEVATALKIDAPNFIKTLLH